MILDSLIFLFLMVLAIACVYVAYKLYQEDCNYKHQSSKLTQSPPVEIGGTNHEKNLVKKLVDGGILEYLIYQNLYIPLPKEVQEELSEEYAQIDILVLTKAGFIVVEDKDYSGMIFGKGGESFWTQTLALGRKKYIFYNPVKQNYGHIRALKESLLNIVDVPCFSVITFGRKCKIDNINGIPSGTYVCYSDQLIMTIKNIIENNPSVSYGDNDELSVVLQSYEVNGRDPRIVQLHINNIKKKYRREANYNQEFYDSI